VATQLQKLIQALRGSPQPMPMQGMQPQMPQQMPQQPPQMGGMAGQGLMQARQAYNQYAIQAQEQGQQPMPFEQFIQQGAQ
jgi:hypothetical protein